MHIHTILKQVKLAERQPLKYDEEYAALNAYPQLARALKTCGYGLFYSKVATSGPLGNATFTEEVVPLFTLGEQLDYKTKRVGHMLIDNEIRKPFFSFDFFGRITEINDFIDKQFSEVGFILDMRSEHTVEVADAELTLSILAFMMAIFEVYDVPADRIASTLQFYYHAGAFEPNSSSYDLGECILLYNELDMAEQLKYDLMYAGVPTEFMMQIDENTPITYVEELFGKLPKRVGLMAD
jgi:hypothetical protein